ncbi:hypothetical protein evm_004003 [Chilo suppressalis]|nr:hypothetical protein evm_004003 [Chilo suppressalis]
MAAEVPVCDVLCEAMEYLSKLGSNLRARSESLKEKRIRKDKLKNSHAVQKAADKVLLICELSKKSLENVESGVRTVLSKVKDSYQTSSKKTTSPSTSKKHDHYQYFTVQSRSVRISKKVPLKHYMSVKVLARNMAKSFCDKYPVHYDCKLYRERKSLEKRKSETKVKDSVEELNEEKPNTGERDKSECLVEPTQNNSIECNNSDPDSIKNKHNNGLKSLDEPTESESKLKMNLGDEIQSNDKTTEIGLKVPEEDHLKNNRNEQIHDTGSVNNKYENNTEKDDDKYCPDIKKNSPVPDYGGLEEKVANKKEQCDLKTSKRSNSMSEDTDLTEKSKKHMKKRFKHIRIIDDSSENSSEPLCGEPSVQYKDGQNSSKTDLEISDKSKQQQQEQSEVSEKERNIEGAVDKEEESKSNRPMIKCVSINKLLKPDILKNNESNNLSKENKETSNIKKKIENKKSAKVNSIDKYLAKKKSKDIVDKNNMTKNVLEIILSSDDEEYWSQKRKEVSTFKSKKLTINVNRLPVLTPKFLQIHNLKKITQNSKTVCELGEDQMNNTSCSDKVNNVTTTEKSKEFKQNPSEKIDKVKNSLLNESDSEKSDSNQHSNLEEVVKTVKTALLNFSAADNLNTQSCSTENVVVDKESQENAKSNNHDEQCLIQTEDVELEKGNAKDDLLNNSDSGINIKINEKNLQKTEYNENNTIEIKTSLLAESDSDEAVKNSRQNICEEYHKEDQMGKDIVNDFQSNLLNKDSIRQSQAADIDNHTLSKNNCSENVELSVGDPSLQRNIQLNKDETNKSDDQLNIPLSKKRKRRQSIKYRRKHIMESMHAKKMLLTYSSSDTEDEQLKDALKEIKDSLLKEMSSEEENTEKLKVSNKSSTSSESEEDILRKVKRLKKQDNEGDIISRETEHESTNSEKTAPNSKVQSVDSIDEKSNSGSSKMGRSRAQPGGSSQNSDSQEPNDKDIDGLTNLKSLMKSRRRRDSTTTTDNTENSRKSRQMAKTPLINEDNMLKPDSSSDGASASGAESDGGDADDLPSVTLTGLNGSGIDHLAKDDLLDESDTSTSHNEKEETNKKSESEEDHNPKSKRRKAHAISSDSEAGSSRKKDPGVKLSDFEDSEDESSEPAKRNKRKKVDNERADSDGSAGSSSDDGGTKKRRRIVQLNDSDVSGSDTENEGKNKHGRKNIRKVMGKNQLEEATKKAAREEKERIARIAERQKLYNNLEFDESGKPDEVVLEKVVLDFDPETKEPLIQVDRGLVKKLKPHQANGIKFMWDACFESVKRIKKDRGSGCILAHCMGLGKTLQVVSLTHTLLTHSDLTTVNRVLVVCPLSTVLNWVNEFNMWLKHSETEYDVDVYELSRYKQNSERAFQLQQWLQHGGVCVLGYEMFRNLSADNNKKFKKKMLKNFQEALVDPGPDMVVCDEGHLLKNEKTSLSQSMNRVRTRRRIVLTGTPLQNNLKEYYCMVQFVKPNLLGKYNEYLNRFVNPITNGQYTDSTEHDIRIMKRRSHVLHKMLDGAVQRRDYGVLAPFLPPKHEYVLFITLTEVQIKLYQFYLDNYSRRPLPGKSSGFLFPDFQSLQRIWTHPLVLKYNSERYEIMQQKKREREEEDSEGSLVDFIDDDSTPDESTTDESSDDLSDASDDSRKKSKKKKSQKKGKGKDSKMSTRRGTRANPVELDEDEANNDVVEIKEENPTEWWIKLVTDDEIDDMRNSHKLVLLFDILRQCDAIGDKLLVFSQSLYSLDLIEHFLGKVDEATQEGRIDEKLAGHVGSWSPGVDYFRLDGSTSCENRSIWCKNFNREDNPRARLFLISTRAGGLGINLVAANRVVIFDVSWNPSHDVQSIFRVYRFGQKKPCYIYRFLAMGTMEEKIYERQVTKQAISKRVIDEQQIDRHYAENDLAELYKFEPRPPTPRPLPPLPKDRLFAEMLKEHEAQIYKYHEHDSLLENKEEETLSEEERKAAWEDFENEKNRPPPAPFPSAWPMHNGMVPGLLAQQQQQLAYAALAAMLRKDMPNINDNTIRDMLPHIYNSNPALMQKLSELYKFAPGGMMNPAMMNPVMNAAGGGGAGALGGASGLQYEPPWQRQHQQQQQLRLQQLMQHQNQMGAKYYAGGLGSRDPVAMALQQQRAREIMAGDARARPRGRPPLQPRAPALAAPPAHAAHADVVNLDSDYRARGRRQPRLRLVSATHPPLDAAPTPTGMMSTLTSTSDAHAHVDDVNPDFDYAHAHGDDVNPDFDYGPARADVVNLDSD